MNQNDPIHMSLKYSNLGLTPVKITEILRNSEKNRRNFDEKLQALQSPSNINKNCVEMWKHRALKNHRNLEWREGKNVDLVKSFSMSIYYLLAKIGFDTAQKEHSAVAFIYVDIPQISK